MDIPLPMALISLKFYSRLIVDPARLSGLPMLVFKSHLSIHMTNSSTYYALKKTTCMIIQQLLEEGQQVRRITASKHKRGEGPLMIWYSEVSVKCEWLADWQTHGVYVKYATVQGD